MAKKIWQVYKAIPHPSNLNIAGAFDVYFVGGKSSCEKYMKENPSSEWHLGTDITPEEFQWFDGDGYLTKNIAGDIVEKCTKFNSEKMAIEIGFDVSPCLNVARKYLYEYYGDHDNYDDKGSVELSGMILWIACDTIETVSKENDYEYDSSAWAGCMVES